MNKDAACATALPMPGEHKVWLAVGSSNARQMTSGEDELANG